MRKGFVVPWNAFSDIKFWPCVTMTINKPDGIAHPLAKINIRDLLLPISKKTHNQEWNANTSFKITRCRLPTQILLKVRPQSQEKHGRQTTKWRRPEQKDVIQDVIVARQHILELRFREARPRCGMALLGLCFTIN